MPTANVHGFAYCDVWALDKDGSALEPPPTPLLVGV
jgi:hypothetical protein